MRTSLLFVGIALLAGCEGPSFHPPVDAQLRAAQVHQEKHPIGRFQVASSRQFPNGTEVYILDTQTGQVCYYFIFARKVSEAGQNEDMQSCAGPPLAPAY